MAQTYLDGVGWIDDGSGDNGYQQPAPVQSPYAWNYTYDEPSQPAQQSPYAWNNVYNPPAPQPQTPVRVPSISDFYEQESQQADSSQYYRNSYDYSQQPKQQAYNPWDFSQGYYNPQPQQQPQMPSVSDFYEQESRANDNAFKTDGTISNFYEQESYQPDYLTNRYGEQTSQYARAQYAQADVPDASGASWTAPVDNGESGSFGYGGDWANAGTISDFYQEESKTKAEPTVNPYVPYWEQEVTKPPLPYQQGYDPQVGSVLDPSKAFERANPETFKNTDAFNQTLNAFGALPAAVYGLLGGAANSDIPVVNDAAGTVRNAWDQVVSPALNALPATIGDLVSGRGEAYKGFVDPLNKNGPSTGQKFFDALSAVWDPNQATEVNQNITKWAQDFHDNELAQGKAEQEAEQNTLAFITKLKNPVNYSQYQGLQDFSKLPAAVQLAVGFADPVGNAATNFALRPFTQGIPKVVGQVAEKTGASRVIDNVLETTVRAPEQRAYRFSQVSDRVISSLDQAAESVARSAAEVLPEFLFNKASPIYYEKVMPGVAKDRIAQETIDRVQYAYNNSPQYKGGVPDPAIGVGKVPPAESTLAQNMQDTGQRPLAQPDPFTQTPPVDPALNTVDPRQAAINAQMQPEFDAIGSATPAVEPVALPDKYKPVKLPLRETTDASEFFNAAKTMQAIDVKALKLAGKADSPSLRPALPLEEWGKLGSVIRGFNKYTTQPLSRVYLETLSRAVRDPASNLLKLGIVDPGAVGSQVMRLFGVGDANATNARFKTIFGDVEPTGPASMSAEVGGGRTGKESGLGNLIYHGFNPLNELSADVLRKATGGKFQSYSKFVEDNETTLKNFLYKREALRVYDDAVKAGPKTEFFKANPEIWQAVQSGKMSMEQLDKVIQGRTFNGFDLNDLVNNRYNPANISDTLAAELDSVAAGTAGTYGEILKQGIGSIKERVDAENARRLEAQRKVSGYYRAKTPKAKELADANARANAKLIRLEDIDSSHPLVQKMVEDTLNAYDANRVALFPKDNAVYNAAHYLINAAVNYAADTKRFDLFSTAFKDAQATRETFYANKYKAPPTDFDRMMALKDKYESDAPMTPREVKEYETLRNSIPIRQQAADTGVVLPEGETGPGLPQPTPGVRPDYSGIYDAINNPPAVRFKADRVRGGKTMGAVLTPDAMRKLAAKFNRKDTVTARGDVYNSATTREQINKWFQDFMATDQYYRQVSNNTFKLDPDTLSPVRISDGISLNELMRKEPPARIGPEIPPLPDELAGVKLPEFLDTMKARYGADAGKGWADLDPANRDIIVQEISRSILGVDPLNPLTNPKASAEHARAVELLQKYLDDMDSRKAKYAEDVQTGANLTEQFDLDMEQVTQSLMAERFQAAYAARTAAYDKVKSSFFDYRDKNRIDQVLGTILPFQYWARQNFAYLARHFAANPYHFAAILNFYKELEQENNDPTIPGYARFNIHLAQGNGQHWMWDIGSIIPFNPLGDSQAFGGLVTMSDEELARVKEEGKVANSQPFGFFDPSQWAQFAFGKDKVNSQGKVNGREKGVLSSWLRFNPAIQDFLQTGVPNKWMAQAGWLGQGQTLVGQDYPEETRGQKERLGILPAATQYRTFGALTTLTQKLRDAGVIKGDFDPEGPLNEIAYGRNAGKPQTAIYQELVRMTAGKEITDDEAKRAIIAYKSGTYDSKALLAAMDRVEADDVNRKLLSSIGFSTVLSNTPREQVTNAAYKDQSAAYDAAGKALPGYTLGANGYATANKSPVSEFYDKNPAAGVLSSIQTNDTPETIAAGLASDKTFDAIDKLKADQKSGKIDYNTYSSKMDELRGANPAFFEKYPYYDNTPEGDKYFQKKEQYQSIGGDNFDKMQTEAFAAKDKGDEDGYKKIVSSPAYKKASNDRLDFLLANPDFQKQYTESNDKLARENAQELVGSAARSNPQLTPRPQKTLEDLQFTKTTNEYYDIGGDKFDKLQTEAYAARDAGNEDKFKQILASKEYTTAIKKRNDFVREHPEWYKERTDAQVARGGTGNYSGPLPPTAKNSKRIPDLIPNNPKTIEDIDYSEQLSEYYSKGGATYDKQQAEIKKYFDTDQDAKAYGIINSRDYQRVQSTLDQFKLDNPTFADRFDKEYTAKYGKPPKSDTDKLYDSQRAQFYNIGGARYDQLSKQVSDYFDSNQSDKAYAIQNSREFKSIQAARDTYLIDNSDFAQRYNSDYTAKYGKAPKADAEKEFDDLKGQYANIGGAKYDALAALANQYYEAKNTAAYRAIRYSDDYVQAKAARDQFLDDHPAFAKQYKAENEAKYGTTGTSSSSSTGTKSTGSSSSYSSSKSSSSYSSYTPKKSYTSYAKSTSGGSAKNYNTQNRSGNTGQTGKKEIVTSPTARKQLSIVEAFSRPWVLTPAPAPANRTSFNGTTYPARSSTPSTPTATPATATQGSTWDAAQKRKYALLISQGKAKAYAAAAANNLYKPYTPKK